jgi:molecular chaperone DnaK (HSP70)
MRPTEIHRFHIAPSTQVFTTVHDNQTEMDVLILEGNFSQASLCSVLGQMTLTGLVPAPKGEICQ